METTFEHIPVDLIATDWAVLRKVRREEQSYVDLRASIRDGGIKKPIFVRKITQGNQITFSLIDGLHRLTIARELDHATIPCAVVEHCTDIDTLAWQVQLNIQHVNTRPSDLARQVHRIYNLDNKTSLAKVAALFGKSVSWVRNTLDLNDLPQLVLDLVDQNEITLGNAILLVKAPENAVVELIGPAQERTYEEFEVLVAEKIKELRTHNVSVGEGEDLEWKAPPERRKIQHLLAVIKNFDSVDDDVGCNILQTDWTEDQIFQQGIAYALSLDQITVEKRKEERQTVVRQQKLREAERKHQQKLEEQNGLKEEIEKLKASLGEN